MTERIDDEKEDDGNSALSLDLPGYENFNSYIAEGYKVIAQGVKAAGSIPSGRNYQFYQTYNNFRDKMREKFTEIHDVMEDILRSQGLKHGVRDCMMDDAMDVMVTLNDQMLDRATKYMDVMEGIKTGLGELVQEVSGSWNRAKKSNKQTQFTLNIKKNIPRPQFTFKDKIDNSNTVWQPKIKEKPNAMKPLELLMEETVDGNECFKHPYEYELEMFSVPAEQLKKQSVKKPLDLDQTPYELIQTEQQLEDLISYLDTEPAFAVDLENHSYRSFLGFTCLIQISTKQKDFLIDTLALRHVLHSLNRVFTNPTILKVFHGADQDIIWLQRDFSVYVVNMFDTYQAAKLLNYPKLSLAYLLSIYCKVDANKHFQLFDWRIRPLPEEAVKYAREDTHYLLYIADMMSNQLISKANGNTNILKAAYEQSKQVCTKRFEKLIIDEESYMNVYRKGKRFFDNRQLFALKALYLWRDKTARELDESTAYVLPHSMMLNIAENIPREVQGILACCNPVPPLVKANLLEIHYLLLKAKEQPLVKVITESTRAQVSTQKALGLSEEQMLLDQWYYPPGEFRDDLPTLLKEGDDNPPCQEEDNESEESCQPSITIFSKKGNWFNFDSGDKETELDNETLERLQGLNFVSPYQRYIQVLPYSARLEKERKELEAKEAEDHRQRSREQQALAMEIKSLQESGLIKLHKTEEESSREQTLKIEVMAERKRRNEEAAPGAVPRKLRRRANRREQTNSTVSPNVNDPSPHSNDDQLTPQAELRGSEAEDVSGSVATESRTQIKDEEEVKKEQDQERKDSMEPDPPQHKFNKNNKPSSWKEIRQMQRNSFKPFNYSQVDFNQKFGGGVQNQNQKQNKPAALDKKRKWKTNPGANKFGKKKRKRNPVV